MNSPTLDGQGAMPGRNRARPAPERRTMDLILLAVLVGFFLLTVALVRLLEKV
ncbi:MAG: hypothetical protein Q7W56_03590 [Candidatus Latescibacteria bacterium]|nr:hypothetical protein [Candidatus Latescibacterota bacterium]